MQWSRLALWLLFCAAFHISAQYQVIDAKGNKVASDTNPQRIIALAPHIVENLYLVGGFDRIVATTAGSDFPKQATAIPIVADSEFVNGELLVALKPDLIIAWDYQQQFKLESNVDVPIYYSQIQTIDDLLQELTNFGKILKTEAIAQQQIFDLKNTIKQIQAIRQTKMPTPYYISIWNQPEMTLNNEALINQLLALCQLHNIFGSETQTAPIVSVEQIHNLQPQLIIKPSESDTWQQQWHKQNELAVAKLITLPYYAVRMTPRVVDVALSVCQNVAD